MTRPSLASLLLLLATGPACVNEDRHFYEVRLDGRVATEDPDLDGQGEVHLELHHGYLGEGVLRRPLGSIEQWTLDPAERQLQDVVLVSTDGGAEGLVLHGWLDLDQDGVLCGVTASLMEPAGLLVLDYPAHEIGFELVLDSPCKGAEALYP